MGACSRALACCRRVAIAAADWVAVRLVAGRSVACGLRRGARLRVIVLWCLAPVVAAAGALLALAVPRQAGAAPSPAPASLPANCVVAAGTATCTFADVGAVQSFVVPAGVEPDRRRGRRGAGRGRRPVAGLRRFSSRRGGRERRHPARGAGGQRRSDARGVRRRAGRERRERRIQRRRRQRCEPGPVSGGGGGGASDVRTQPFGVGDRVIVGGGGGGGAGGLNDSVITATGAAGGAGGAGWCRLAWRGETPGVRRRWWRCGRYRIGRGRRQRGPVPD